MHCFFYKLYLKGANIFSSHQLAITDKILTITQNNEDAIISGHAIVKSRNKAA